MITRVGDPNGTDRRGDRAGPQQAQGPEDRAPRSRRCDRAPVARPEGRRTADAAPEKAQIAAERSDFPARAPVGAGYFGLTKSLNPAPALNRSWFAPVLDRR